MCYKPIEKKFVIKNADVVLSKDGDEFFIRIELPKEKIEKIIQKCKLKIYKQIGKVKKVGRQYAEIDNYFNDKYETDEFLEITIFDSIVNIMTPKQMKTFETKTDVSANKKSELIKL